MNAQIILQGLKGIDWLTILKENLKQNTIN